MAAADTYRLPRGVRPLRYRITLTPDMERHTFEGSESIDIRIEQPTDRIVLNAIELGISRATIRQGSAQEAVGRVALDEDAQRATCVFDRRLQPGDAVLDLQFTGLLNDQLRGFYRSEYTAVGGQSRLMVSTHFEATDARRAFPCWDEPATKTPFVLTLVVPSDLVALANMPVESESPSAGGRKIVRFAESPPMSTYLLAFAVGDLAAVEGRAAGGTQVRVWATRGKEQQGRFALENAIKLLGYFNDYFGTPYPLPKLDHIAIPDFASGAMENWGAIMYRETALLFDPANSAAATRQRIMEVVAHEMAHMWFGDLVTMEWWDDLWLNESFASWMGNKAVDHLFPEWNMWAQFIYEDTNSGLGLDSLKNSHPIEQTVNDPAEIRELFDAISYSKGAAILRMLEDYLTADVFRQGLRDYMVAHQYGNARTVDLWNALTTASRKDVGALMGSWTRQMGFPLLTARLRREPRRLRVALSQQRFLYDHILGEEPEPTLWQIPVSIAQSGVAEPAKVLMGRRDEEVVVPRPSPSPESDWAKINVGHVGFFRVAYPPQEWKRLQAAVDRLELPATDRLGLQSDAYALVRGGYVPATQFIALAEAYSNENDVSVWSDLTAGLRGVEFLLYDEPSLPRYQAHAGSLYEKIVRKVGWEPRAGEGHLDSLLRATVLSAKGAFGDPALAREARRRFDRFLDDPASLHPDLRATVYGLVAQDGDRSAYNTLWDMEKKATLHEEKTRLLLSMSRFRDTGILRDLLNRSLTSEVRVQDTVQVIAAVGGTRAGRDIAWEFTKANWAELDRRYGKGGFAISRLVNMIGIFTTMEAHRDVESFFQSHPTPAAARTIQQSLERIRLNVAWRERNARPIAAWLARRSDR